MSSPNTAEELQRLTTVLAAQREAYGKAPYPSLQERREHLDRLEKVLRENIDAIVEALNTDFGGRSADETKIAEILTSLEGIKYYRKRIKKWMQPERRSLRSEEHTSELQSRGHLVCRLLLETKKRDKLARKRANAL